MQVISVIDFVSCDIAKFTDSVQFSHSVVSDSLQTHELQHARPPCSSPTPRVPPNPCPLNQWCHPTISSSVVPFSSYPQFFPESGSFQISQLFASGGQSIGASASASVIPMNIQGWFSLGLNGLFSFITLSILFWPVCENVLYLTLKLSIFLLLEITYGTITLFPLKKNFSLSVTYMYRHNNIADWTVFTHWGKSQVW